MTPSKQQRLEISRQLVERGGALVARSKAALGRSWPMLSAVAPFPSFPESSDAASRPVLPFDRSRDAKCMNLKDAEEALNLIQKAWTAWAANQIPDDELAARVADGLEWCGMAWHGMAWHGMAWRRSPLPGPKSHQFGDCSKRYLLHRGDRP
jgi:hypothetical protein